jgi:decaprenyl-phosphate phosphoribosyltransferase
VPRSDKPASTLALSETAAIRRGSWQALLATARPKQWVKNALVIAAAAAAGALGHDDVPVRVCLACAAFCMLASGIYAINDVRDAAEDRLHPRKCQRPVAAGQVTPRTAAAVGIASIFAGLMLCFAIRPLLGLVGISYVALTVTYTLLWRHIVVLDIVAIAGGFVLRAIAGGVAAPVGLSRWFLLVVTFSAVLVAAGKRYSELLRSSGRPAPGRRVLRAYSGRGLGAILLAAGVGAAAAYWVWALELPIVGGVPWRLLTIAPFMVALARFGSLVLAGKGETPEDLLLGDRWLTLATVAWFVLFALSVNAAS